MFALKKIITGIYILLSLAFFILSLNLRSPLFFKLRYYDLCFLFTGSIALLFLILKHKKVRETSFKLFFTCILLLFIALFIGFYTELKFQYIKYKVLNTEDNILSIYGEHFIVGYDNPEELAFLSEKGAIGGIFITAKNVKNKKPAAIKRMIGTLQAARQKKSLPVLFVTTDQEGGAVSRLSPPLKYLPSLSDVYKKGKGKARIKIYAREKAELLKNIGINVNFSPVVDLKIKHTVNMMNLHTLIWQRAISADPAVVSNVALDYCKELNARKIIPVLKHFPGLGRIAADTHFFTASLNSSVEELFHNDWIPYREIPAHVKTFIMLGHVKLKSIDDKYPASYSKKIVEDVVRKKLKFKGVLITDDFSMGPVFYAWEPISEIVVKALNAGIDQILISYDYDLYYYIMYDLIYKKRGDIIEKEKLKQSKFRIEQAKKLIMGK